MWLAESSSGGGGRSRGQLLPGDVVLCAAHPGASSLHQFSHFCRRTPHIPCQQRSYWNQVYFFLHIIRRFTEEKAKVIAAVRDLINSLPRQLFCPSVGRFEEIGWIHPFCWNYPGANHPFLQIVQVKSSYRGKELNKFCPPNGSDDLCFFFFIHPLSMLFLKSSNQV